jgi:hypothetical protein
MDATRKDEDREVLRATAASGVAAGDDDGATAQDDE